MRLKMFVLQCIIKYYKLIAEGFMAGKTDKTSKAVRLDEQTYKRLKALGNAKKRAPHWLMQEAIHQYLEREEEIAEVNRDTLERWARIEAGEKTIPHEVVDKWLASLGTE